MKALNIKEQKEYNSLSIEEKKIYDSIKSRFPKNKNT